MPDKERLVKLLVEYGITDRYIYDLCDEIEECFADELEKARLWDRVKEVAHKSPPCDCPLWDEESEGCTSEHAGCVFKDVVDALEKEPR